MGRRKRTDVRQEEIAHVVLELIASEGHKALSMVAVAKRIGVVPSALYRHYPCKEDMIIAALQLHKQERLNELNKILTEHTSILAAYTEFMGSLPCFVGHTAALPRITFGLLPHSSDRLRHEARKLFDGFIQKINNDFEKAKQQGELGEDVNCYAAAMSLWGVLVTAVIRFNIFGPDFDPAAHVKHGWELFLRAIRPDPLSPLPESLRVKPCIPEAKR